MVFAEVVSLGVPVQIWTVPPNVLVEQVVSSAVCKTVDFGRVGSIPT